MNPAPSSPLEDSLLPPSQNEFTPGSKGSSSRHNLNILMQKMQSEPEKLDTGLILQALGNSLSKHTALEYYFTKEQTEKYHSAKMSEIDYFKITHPFKIHRLDFDENKILGTGTFGIVFKGVNPDNGQIMAIKKIPVQGNPDALTEIEEESK